MKSEQNRCTQLLSRINLFQNIDGEHMTLIARNAQIIEEPRKKKLLRYGEICKCLYVVIYGSVQLTIPSMNGVEKPVQILQAGDIFGDITMILDRSCYLTAETMEDSFLISIPWECIMFVFEADVDFAKRMILGIALRMRSLVANMESSSRQSPSERVVSYLLQLLAEPHTSNDVCEIQLPTKKKTIAAQLNLQPETLSRSLRDLVEHELIQMSGSSVRIYDRERLALYAESKSRQSDLCRKK